jgi:hypothetical protein
MVHDGVVKPIPAVPHGRVLSYVQNVAVEVRMVDRLDRPHMPVPFARYLVPLLKFLHIPVVQ